MAHETSGWCGIADMAQQQRGSLLDGSGNTGWYDGRKVEKHDQLYWVHDEAISGRLNLGVDIE